jgi:hypothetical protein
MLRAVDDVDTAWKTVLEVLAGVGDRAVQSPEDLDIERTDTRDRAVDESGYRGIVMHRVVFT